MIEKILRQFGLSEKETKVYLALLELGPASVRKIAEQSGINRGTSYDILKSLIDQGLASYFYKEKNQYFVAEDPERLVQVLENKANNLTQLEGEIKAIIPELKSLTKSGQKPVVKFYEGYQGIKSILQDVLEVMSKVVDQDREYLVYSSADISQYLYKEIPDFTEQRIKKKIKVKTIASGEGGKEYGLDERRWLTKEKSSPTYILIYANRVAMISLTTDKKPLGVIIEDNNLATTQKMIHNFIWQKLK